MGGLVALIIVVALAVGILGNKTPLQSGFIATVAPAITAADHARGDASASVSVIEYGDFECPACAAYEPLVEQLTKNYSGRITFIFRNFPLQQHRDAQIAAQAAEAAGLQGKYWEMHDLLYKKQDEWSKEGPGTVGKYFDSYAQSLGLDITKFHADMNSDAVKNKVASDAAGGNSARIDHTPTFFVNLKQIQNPTSAGEFNRVIDAAIASSTAAASAGQTTPTSSTGEVQGRSR